MASTLALAVVISPVRSPGTARVQESKPKSGPKARLADFAWMEGTWKGDLGNNAAELYFSGPADGVITSIMKLHGNGKVLVVEVANLVEAPDGVVEYIRHFSPKLEQYEKADPIFLKVTGLDATTVEFDNPVNGQPKQTIITRKGPDAFTAHSDLYDEKGEHDVIEVTYARVK
ncbi:MAG: DUF6265 family protein [Candidatus Acidiferrales bacterium]